MTLIDHLLARSFATMSTQLILIHELAERAGTTVRTIRYYADEGLLPQPVTQGKYSYYTQSHLDRLELIRRMKDAFLPLRHIKNIMDSLTDEDVQQRLLQQPPSSPQASPAAYPPKDSGSSALEYISRVMDKRSEYKPIPLPPAPAPAQFTRENQQPAPASRSLAPLRPPAAENWLRIQLAPGVELHLRNPTDADGTIRVNKLIDFAKRIFERPGAIT